MLLEYLEGGVGVTGQGGGGSEQGVGDDEGLREVEMQRLQASEAELKQALEDAQQANTQWAEYASTMGEKNAALEAELAALKAEVSAQQGVASEEAARASVAEDKGDGWG